MLGPSTEETIAWRHYVGCRVDAAAGLAGSCKHSVVTCEPIVLKDKGAKFALKRFPGVDLVEELEQQDAKQHFIRRTGQIIPVNDIAN